MANPTNFWDVATPIIAILAPVITVWINNRHQTKTDRLRWVREFKREAYQEFIKQLSSIYKKDLCDGNSIEKHSEIMTAITSFYAVIECDEAANEFRALVGDLRDRFHVAIDKSGKMLVGVDSWKTNPDFDTLIEIMLDIASSEMQRSMP